jgi:hypothetical protein
MCSFWDSGIPTQTLLHTDGKERVGVTRKESERVDLTIFFPNTGGKNVSILTLSAKMPWRGFRQPGSKM